MLNKDLIQNSSFYSFIHRKLYMYHSDHSSITLMFRWAWFKIANSNDKDTCLFLLFLDRAILFWNQLQEFSCVSLRTIRMFATREHIIYFQNIFLYLSYDGENYEKLVNSKYLHDWSLGLGNYNGNALTTGCQSSKQCYVKTEIFEMATMTWSSAEDYPYGSWVKLLS